MHAAGRGNVILIRQIRQSYAPGEASFGGQAALSVEPPRRRLSPRHERESRLRCVALLNLLDWSSKRSAVVDVQNANIEMRSIARKSLICRVSGYKFAM